MSDNTAFWKPEHEATFVYKDHVALGPGINTGFGYNNPQPKECIVIGLRARSDHDYCIVIGTDAYSTADYQIVFGDCRREMTPDEAEAYKVGMQAIRPHLAALAATFGQTF